MSLNKTIFAPYSYNWSIGDMTNYKIPDLKSARKILNIQKI